MADSREIIDEALVGDILGLYHWAFPEMVAGVAMVVERVPHGLRLSNGSQNLFVDDTYRVTRNFTAEFRKALANAQQDR